MNKDVKQQMLYEEFHDMMQAHKAGDMAGWDRIKLNIYTLIDDKDIVKALEGLEADNVKKIEEKLKEVDVLKEKYVSKVQDTIYKVIEDV